MFKINNKEMDDVWMLPAVTMEEKRYGKHPTQKPVVLLERIIRASTKPGDLILDPFMGSGTTGVVCKYLCRHFYGIEKEKGFYKLSHTRIYGV